MIYPLFAKTHLLLQLYSAHSLCSANSFLLKQSNYSCCAVLVDFGIHPYIFSSSALFQHLLFVLGFFYPLSCSLSQFHFPTSLLYGFQNS